MKGVFIGIMYLITIVIIFVLVGLIVSFTWNATMPYLFGLPELGIGKGLALAILAKMLFGFGGITKKEE